MATQFRPVRAGRDAGSALVAAVGVAIIGIALSLVVVSQAISIRNDASRDRVRTVEVHAAEAALDAVFKTLEATTPCSGSMTSGAGATAVNVSVSIRYLDASGAEVVCVDGVLAGVATQAVITTSAVPANPAPNVAPERRMEARVNLVPVVQQSAGAALFSAGSMTFQNSAEVLAANPTDKPIVWVENQNYSCANSFKLDGSLIVTDGSITMSNKCNITGNVWVKTNATVSGSSSPFKVGGNLVVYSGNLVNNSPTPNYGGSVSVGGTISGNLNAAGAVCSTNVGSRCGTLPLYVKRGLPTVTLDMNDWTPLGFTYRTKAQFSTDTGMADACNWSKATMSMPAAKRVYDLTTCDVTAKNTVEMKVYADTAIFLKSFSAANQFNVTSGDGAQHNVWFIVPSTGTGGFVLKNSADFVEPIHMFFFAPGPIDLANSAGFTGQAYGGTILARNSVSFTYAGVGIPGVDLGEAVSTSAGFTVEIVNKHEISN